MPEPENPPQTDWGRESLAQVLVRPGGKDHPELPRSGSGLLHKGSQEERQQDQVWDGRLMTFVASTGAADRNGNILDVEGWELDNYRANPVVLFNHNWDLPPVGRTSRLAVEGNRLLAQIEFAPTPLGHELSLLNTDGYLRAISVGARPLEWEVRRHPEHGYPIGFHSHRQELIELSIVAIPANPATVRAALNCLCDSHECPTHSTGLPLSEQAAPDLPADALLSYLGTRRTASSEHPAASPATPARSAPAAILNAIDTTLRGMYTPARYYRS